MKQQLTASFHDFAVSLGAHPMPAVIGIVPVAARAAKADVEGMMASG